VVLAIIKIIYATLKIFMKKKMTMMIVNFLNYTQSREVSTRWPRIQVTWQTKFEAPGKGKTREPVPPSTAGKTIVVYVDTSILIPGNSK